MCKYCLEVTEAFEKAFDLSGSYYVYSTFPLTTVTTPFEEGITYEEVKVRDGFEKEQIRIVLNYAVGKDEPEAILDGVIRAMEKMERENMTVAINLVISEKVESVKYDVNSHYNTYGDGIDDYFECAGYVEKEGGKINLSQEEKQNCWSDDKTGCRAERKLVLHNYIQLLCATPYLRIVCIDNACRKIDNSISAVCTN